MCQYRVFLYAFLLLVSNTFDIHAEQLAETAVVSEYLAGAFPKAEIKLSDDLAGTLKTEDGTAFIRAFISPSFDLGSNDAIYGVILTFPKDADKANQLLFDSGKVELPMRKPLLLFRSPANMAGGVQTVVLDERAIFVRDIRLDISDFAGIGEPQIWCEYNALHAFEAPIERRFARRLVLVSPLDGRTILKTTLGVSAIGLDKIDEQILTRLVFTPSGASGPKSASLLEVNSSIVRATSKYVGGQYIFESVEIPDVRPEKGRKRLVREATEAELTVVDAATGLVVVGAKVEAKSITMSPIFGHTSRIQANGETDRDGKFYFKAKNGFSAEIWHLKYYPERVSMDEYEMGDGKLRVLLTPLGMEVKMHANRLDYINKQDIQDEYLFQVKLNSSGADVLDENMQGIGDLVFTFRRDGERYVPGALKNSMYINDNWLLTVTAQNGWSIAYGPDTSDCDRPGASGLRMAPDSGYVREIELGISSACRAFFVRSPEPARFGKIYGMRVNQSDSKDSPEFSVELKYMIQKEAVNSTSLNAIED